MLPTTTILGGTAIIGVLAAGWSYVKIYLQKLISYVIVSVTSDNRHISMGMHVILNKVSVNKKSPANKVYDCKTLFIKSLNKKVYAIYEKMTYGIRIYWVKETLFKIPVIIPIIFKGRTPSQGSGPESESDSKVLHIIYIRGTIDIDKLFSDAMDSYIELNDVINDNTNKRFFVRKVIGKGINQHSDGHNRSDAPDVIESDDSSIMCNFKSGIYRLLKYKIEDIGVEGSRKDPLDSMVLDKHSEELVIELNRWLKSKDWFTTRGIPWKRGWLLHGLPGTGKTSFIRAIGEVYDLPIISFDLGSLTNEEFVRKWQEISHETPCIALIEDIDNVFHGRTNVAGDRMGNLSFDTFLNCIDGIDSNNGILLVITTNDITKLDPALGKPSEKDINVSTRPGRIDRVLEMKVLSKTGREKIAKRILDNWPETHEKIVSEGDGESGAQFQERCTQLALKLYWQEKDKTTLDNVTKNISTTRSISPRKIRDRDKSTTPIARSLR